MKLQIALVAALMLTVAATAQPTSDPKSARTYPVPHFEYCTAPIKQWCADHVTPKLKAQDLAECLRSHWDDLNVTCQMNVKDHFQGTSWAPHPQGE